MSKRRRKKIYMLTYCLNFVLIFMYGILFLIIEKRFLRVSSSSFNVSDNYARTIFKRFNNIKGQFICILIGIQLFIISALRVDTGFDFDDYNNIFIEISHLRIKDFLTFPVEKGYELLNAFIAIFTQNFQWVIVITAFLTIVILTVVVYRYSENYILSFLLYIPFFYFFTLSGIRQGLALSISLLSFQFLREKKFFKYCFVVFLATSFHYTAIILLPAYFILNIKLTWKKISVFGALTLIIYLFTERIFLLMSRLIPKYSGYGTGEGIAQYLNGQSWKSIVVSVLVFVLMLLFHRRLEEKDARNSVYLNIAFISVLLSIFQTKVGVLDRFPYYFNIYMIFSLPMLVDCFDQKFLTGLVCRLPYKWSEKLQSHVIYKLPNVLLKSLVVIGILLLVCMYSYNTLSNNYFGILPYHTFLE